jgi:hypothetical protein
MCSGCTRHAVEDESHVLFECPAKYQQIRHDMVVACFLVLLGDTLQCATRVLTRDSGSVPEFINQEPKVVACFVVPCMPMEPRLAPFTGAPLGANL